MTETAVEIKSGFSAARDVVRTLKDIGDRLPDQFQIPLIVGYFAGDDPQRPPFSFYCLAEKVRTRLFGFIPRTQKRVLVAMYDPSRYHGGQVGCTVLDACALVIAKEAVNTYARLKGTENVTIVTDNNPLFI